MAAGSCEGVVANNNLRLYSYWKSSCSFRVRIALNLKEFLKLNPLGFVPVLLDGDAGVADSFAIVMYLEYKYPQQHPLLPHDIRKRAINFQKYIEEKVSPEEKPGCAKNSIYKGFTGSFRLNAFTSVVSALERLLKKHAGRYATGDQVLLADLFLAPQLYAAFTMFDIDMKEFPILAGLHETYMEIPAFREPLPENQPDADAVVH